MTLGVSQGPDVAQQYTDQLQTIATRISDQAEPAAQKFIDEQLQPNAQHLAKTLEPRVSHARLVVSQCSHLQTVARSFDRLRTVVGQYAFEMGDCIS